MSMGRFSAALSLLTVLACAATVDAQLSEAELTIWNTPAFQQRFAESYLAETDVEPVVDRQERAQMQDVLELMAADQLQQAATLLERKVTDKSSAVVDFTLANLYFQLEKLEQAAKTYEQAVEKFPRYRRAWRNLGLIYVRLVDYPNALRALTRVIELGGGESLTYGLLGFTHSNLDDSLSAETAYRMAILLDPDTMDWRMGLARSLFRQERYADAAALLDRLLAIEPTRTDLWLLQANAFIGLKQPIKAAENYEFVDQLGGSTIESLNMLGDIYVNEELFDLAVDTYARALAMAEKGDVKRAMRAATALTMRGALEETKTLVQAIQAGHGDQLGPDEQKELLKLQARIAVAEGAGDEEARVLEQIVKIDPLDGEAIILLGRHSSRNGDPQQAILWYERAAGLEEFEADAKVRHAQVLVGESRYADALPLLRRAQQINPRENVQEYLEQVERMAKSRS